MKEVEIKILNISKDGIQKKLHEKEAKFIKDVIQEDIFFTSKAIKEQGLKARLRIEPKNSFFTLKTKAIVEDGFKVAEENEIMVSDSDQFLHLLLSLGLKERFRKKVQRAYYSLSNCSVEIIEHPALPPYLEIEGLPKDILQAAQLLDLSSKDFFTSDIFDYYGIDEKTSKKK